MKTATPTMTLSQMITIKVVRSRDETFKGILKVYVPAQTVVIEGYAHHVPVKKYQRAVGMFRITRADAQEDAERARADYISMNQLP